ncbi:hypothetical protein B0E52_07030 [Rhodanobacter sp. C06]|uniref:lipoprotein N-acyltransferase Lnb domain-containing protein n=1 Tax=Rhodanobacter sp. C06 TaxID=1945854 RepID=UPI0009868F92|nr:DUF4105 domain-containing protein [Rhodanobacter sp. C06]OOG44891.1 hypothetical protein B0E52_07030 [Rhodanobacter sp. C06]
MRITSSLLALLALFLLAIAPAHASVANAPGANLEVSLVTYGPGDIYWERFGHDAIELRDAVSGEAVNFNYGVFDFNEKNFFLNFARGRMHYLMDAEPTGEEESYYVDVGRSITRQRLALTPEQAGALRDFLFWNLRPENAGYNYDYYIDNCTTRVRDALDKALGGVLKARLATQPGGMSYRQQTDRLMSAQPWLMLLLDLGLGPYADQPMSAWSESFLPYELQANLRGIRVPDGHGGSQPLVQDEQLLSPNRLPVPPGQAPDLRLPLGAAGLAFALLLVATARRVPLIHALLATLYLVVAGLVGLLLLMLWTLTSHHAAWYNANLLLFSPLAFLLLRASWRARRGLAPGRFANTVLILQLAAVLIAVLLHLLPGTVQQNQPWLLFALPVWLALAWRLRQPTI